MIQIVKKNEGDHRLSSVDFRRSQCFCSCGMPRKDPQLQEFGLPSGTFRKPQPLAFSQNIAGTNGRRTVVQIGGVRQYKLEVHCGVSLSPKFTSQQGRALQMGGVLRYKLEVYCQYFSDKLYRLGVPEQFPFSIKIKNHELSSENWRQLRYFTSFRPAFGAFCSFLHLLGSVFARTDFSRICIFGPAGFSRGFCRRTFSPHFLWDKVPRPPGKSPAKSSKIYTILQRGRANICVFSSCSMAKSFRKSTSSRNTFRRQFSADCPKDPAILKYYGHIHSLRW